ncbi:hypothetical protein SARC_04037 [Sphaeroforma arctica JP610]|uniref:Uncharacterized protein n=1 Tax=Sphaeroforma arctica JP610 TaxID=667725 RepID=A0A0L0G3P7_9EUKA|nr:hypothetical protein SARC_04037 [Sphaeroforma arctica JP610]KNC83732.1 hypothetical protein SARC_04037 [Sphaeroforma arctica JP610]|eukprot:XP_014157634.1 hypothetical protein SARC_04037 [Sphaeroforma arctica JP610]
MTIEQDLKRSLADVSHNLHQPCKRFHSSSVYDSDSNYNLSTDDTMLTCGSTGINGLDGTSSRRDSGAVCDAYDDSNSYSNTHAQLDFRTCGGSRVRCESSMVLAKAARRITRTQPQPQLQSQSLAIPVRHSISTDEYATLLCRAEPDTVAMSDRDLYNEWVFNSDNSYTPSQIRWLQKHQPAMVGDALGRGHVSNGVWGDDYGNNTNANARRTHCDTDEVLRRQVARFGSKLRTTQSSFL